MPTSVHVDELKINKLTEAQYDAAVQAGLIGENELSILTDAASGGQTIQYDTMPTASASNEGDIVQFVGTSDANYTNGYFYQCVSDGAVTPTYSWVAKEVQVAGDSLPSQTGQSGKFLTTDGTDASWSDKPLVNTATGTNAIGIGEGTTATGNYSIGCGYYSKANGTRSIAIGYGCETTATGGIIISPVNHKQNQPNLIIGRCNDYIAQDCIVLNSIDNNLGMTPSQGDFVVKNSNNAARVLMSADGTIPTDRFTGNNTTPVNAGQYMLTITKDSNGNITRSWEPVVAPSTPATTPVLQGTSTYWIEDQVTHIISQTITVQGVTASNTIFVAPAPVSSADYAAAGIICTAQNTNQLTFTCTTIPTNDIEVNIVIL